MTAIFNGDTGIEIDMVTGAPRIRGDFSNASVASRVMFQSNTVNGNSYVGVAPNGAGTVSGWTASNSSDPSNASSLATYINASTAIVDSGKIGGGSYLPLAFRTGGVEQMRIDTSGNLGIGVSPTNPLTITKAASGDWLCLLTNSAANPYGIRVNYSTADPNNTSNSFFSGYGNNGAYVERVTLRSNGGIANYSANNVNLSDRREKENFAPAKDYLDVICAIPVQTYNYIDQNHDEDPGKTLGVVAQDVQAVAPELVTESNWGDEENPKMRLSIYQTDMQYALMKCIQELKAKNDALEQRIAALEGK